MRYPRLFTCALVLGLLLLLAVPAIASAIGGAPVAVDDTQSYSVAEFVASSPEASAEFGYSVATYQGWLVVVGERYATVSGQSKAGAVWVFTKKADNTLQFQTRLTAPTPVTDQRFGQSVAVYGGTIVVGAPYDTHNGNSAGVAYVFAGSLDRWNLEATLYPSDPQNYDRFGDAVACTDQLVVVGSRGRYSDPSQPTTNKTGAAYVFSRAASTWTQAQKLTDGNGGPYQEFGAAAGVAPDGRVLVGAPGGTVTAASLPGKVCTFSLSGAGWSQGDDLPVTGLSAGDMFGSAMSMFQTYDESTKTTTDHVAAATTASFLTWPNSPKLCEYTHVDGAPGAWTPGRVGTPADPGPMPAFTGSAMALTQDGFYVGMNTNMTDAKMKSGAVYWYGAPQSLTTPYGKPLSIPAPGVLANDFYISFSFSGYQGWSAAVATQPAHGTLALSADGSFIYTPADGFWGTDKFTYTVTVGLDTSNVAAATITVAEPGTFTLSYSADPGGTIEGAARQTVHAGSDGTPVTAAAAKDYHFVQWSDGVKTATRQDTKVGKDISVVAEFAADRSEVALSAPLGYMKPKPRHRYTYAGTMSPKGKAGAREVTVTVQRKAGGHWKTYRKLTAKTVKFSNTQTKYVVSVRFKKTGAYRMRASLSSVTQYGKSSFTFLRVNRKK